MPQCQAFACHNHQGEKGIQLFSRQMLVKRPVELLPSLLLLCVLRRRDRKELGPNNLSTMLFWCSRDATLSPPATSQWFEFHFVTNDSQYMLESTWNTIRKIRIVYGGLYYYTTAVALKSKKLSTFCRHLLRVATLVSSNPNPQK